MNEHTDSDAVDGADSDFETQLRGHLRGRADHVDVRTALGGSLAVKEEARARTHARHRRRMATASVATAAAVAAGLVVIARDPGTQDVSTDRDQAASGRSGLAAGAATGSSTGSSSGSPKGWSTEGGNDVPPNLPGQSLRVPAGYDLVGQGYRSAEQDPRVATAQSAADLAVAADARPGAPLRFVVASVQDSDRLSAGRGGTETTILGRPARIISKRAATTITWDITDTERVLVTVAGVDDAVLADWLGTLAKDASGRWAFGTSGGGGLTAIPTTTPTAQVSTYRTWQKNVAGPDGSCGGDGYDFSLNTGGAYELWATLADSTRWSTSLPSVSSGMLPGRADAALVFESGYGDVVTTDGDLVIRVSRWNGESADAASGAALLDLVFTPTEAERPEVVEPVDDPDCELAKGERGGADPAVTVPPEALPTTSPVGG